VQPVPLPSHRQSKAAANPLALPAVEPSIIIGRCEEADIRHNDAQLVLGCYADEGGEDEARYVV
jgi:hypothetical protein